MKPDDAALERLLTRYRAWLADCHATLNRSFGVNSPSDPATLAEAEQLAKAYRGSVKNFKRELALHKREGQQLIAEVKRIYAAIEYPAPPLAPSRRAGFINQVVAASVRSAKQQIQNAKHSNAATRDGFVAQVDRLIGILDAASLDADRQALDFDRAMDEARRLAAQVQTVPPPAQPSPPVSPATRLKQLEALHKQRQLSSAEWLEVADLFEQAGNNGQAAKARDMARQAAEVGVEQRFARLEPPAQ